MIQAPTKRLGDRLLDAGLITRHQLELALREQKRSGKLIGAVLHELGFVTEEDIAGFLAQDAQAQTVDLERLKIEAETLVLLPYEFCRDSALIACSRGADTLTVVMGDPFDVVAIDRIEQMTRLKVEVLNAPRPDILEKLAIAYEREGSIDQTIDELMKISQHTDGDETTAPMIRAVEQIISAAVRKSVSDIHFEPDEKSLRIRMRTDGVLRPFLLVPKDLQDAFTARLKVMANLDVSETRLPQDGRFAFTVGRRDLNLRVSTMPTNYGESVVLRILDSSSMLFDLSSLGLRTGDEKILADAVTRPHGVLLVTGPTGSGKTTTLYTALNSVNRLERSVFTLEDPIEYRLPHIRQTQISEKIGLTFSAGLRTLLRQDPDVILVGETRDKETAQLMVRAALTGHLVFSSLHTNDAASAIPRLIDLGVEPFLLPATLRVVIAQRLVRRLCPHCREPYRPLPELAARFAHFDAPADGITLHRPIGCEQCNQTGYRGRLVISEVLLMTDPIRKLVLGHATATEIQRQAMVEGMATMYEDGLRKALDGRTTVEEVLRVAEEA